MKPGNRKWQHSSAAALLLRTKTPSLLFKCQTVTFNWHFWALWPGVRSGWNNSIRSVLLSWCFWKIIFHFYFANADGEELMTYTALNHQGEIMMVWLQFWEALMSSVWILQSRGCRLYVSASFLGSISIFYILLWNQEHRRCRSVSAQQWKIHQTEPCD